MKLDADNPMLTAFALGELDEPERAEIEAQLKHDDAARKIVDDIRASASLVTQELKTERAPGLTEKQQAAIYARQSAPAARKVWYWRPLAAAAMLLLTVGVVGTMVEKHAAPERRYAQSEGNGFSNSPVTISVDSKPPSGGDHFEAIRINDGAEAKEHAASLDVSRGPTKEFAANDESAPSSFRNQTTGKVDPITATGEFGGHATGKKVPPVERPAQSSTTPDAISKPPDTEAKSSFVKGHEETPRDFADYQKRVSTTTPVTGAGSVDVNKAELEKLKREIAELKAKEHAATPEKKSDPQYLDIIDAKSPPGTFNFQAGGRKLSNERQNAFKEKLPVPGDVNSLVIPQPSPVPAPGTETYPAIAESGFKRVTDEPLSTFSIDVDTASYANVRRFLNQGQMPPRDAVRIEELLNYFSYNYGQPQGDDPFAIHVEVAQCPWNTTHRLARVGIKGREFAENKRPAGNYVFLIDVSGSMDEPKKQPLVQAGLKMLVDKLGENDRVGIVTYAGEASLALPSTACSDKSSIKRVINSLHSAGSTNGGDGIQRAYKMAAENFIKGGINRVILCTDGDFNVGVTDPNDLTKLIETQAKSGVFLSVLGFGMGDLKDATMQKLADKGNGNYAYIDSLDEVRKVLVDQMTATLATIAKDVKIQVEFNPAVAGAYRLIGYEKRLLNKQDFNNDKVDAGEVGAGHQVTALYEIVPATALESEPGVDPLIYQKNPEPKRAAGANGDLLTLKIRYKQPDSETSKLIKGAVSDNGASYAQASKDFKFAAAVAAFGMLLRESPYRGNTSFDAVLELADDARGKDEGGYRREFLGLVEKAKAMLKR